MAEHPLIRDYATVLLVRLPARLADEVADGLREAYEIQLADGLSPDDAARAAVAEFGDAQDVVIAFTVASPARRVARRLIATGPAVGLCWAVALIAGHAWAWPVPIMAKVEIGATLIASVAVLVTAAVGHGYAAVRRAGGAGCVGVAVVDVAVIALVLPAAPSFGWLLALAALASATRLTCVVRALRPVFA